MAKDACRHCRRPVHWVDGVGWLHGELPQYAQEPITCERAEPVCDGPKPWICEGLHIERGPDPACGCRCHLSSEERSRRG